MLMHSNFMYWFFNTNFFCSCIIQLLKGVLPLGTVALYCTQEGPSLTVSDVLVWYGLPGVTMPLDQRPSFFFFFFFGIGLEWYLLKVGNCFFSNLVNCHTGKLHMTASMFWSSYAWKSWRKYACVFCAVQIENAAEEPRVLCIVQDTTDAKTVNERLTLNLPASTTLSKLFEDVAHKASYVNGTFQLAWAKVLDLVSVSSSFFFICNLIYLASWNSDEACVNNWLYNVICITSAASWASCLHPSNLLGFC